MMTKDWQQVPNVYFTFLWHDLFYYDFLSEKIRQKRDLKTEEIQRTVTIHLSRAGLVKSIHG